MIGIILDRDVVEHLSMSSASELRFSAPLSTKAFIRGLSELMLAKQGSLRTDLFLVIQKFEISFGSTRLVSHTKLLDRGLVHLGTGLF